MAGSPATALVVASNWPSGCFAAEPSPHYKQHPSGNGWLVPLMFADGAGAGNGAMNGYAALVL